MCRLLGYATAGFNLSLNAVLGQDNVEDFRELSEIHNDGWGVAQLSDPAEAPHVRDGGAPTPETGTRIYKSTIAARHENQHPFYANGLSFIHNGDISDANGRNIVTNRSYPVNHSVFLSTGGRSDSAIFFAVILEYIGFGFSLDEAVAQAVRELRQAYPKSSYNCMIQSEDQLIALCAAGREKTSPRIVEIYDEYGRGEQAADYRVMRYRELRDDNGDSAGVVVSSSGYKQEGWNVLENDQMIIVSNRNGTYRLRSI